MTCLAQCADHGPLMEDTLPDQWARWTAWLDLHVKRSGN